MVTKTAVQYPARTDSAPQEMSVSVLPEQTAVDTDVGQAEEKPVMLQKYADLYEENKDFVGWLSIEGMKIDYPVMKNEEDGYYLHHDFLEMTANTAASM